jgi:hypothetical protein
MSSVEAIRAFARRAQEPVTAGIARGRLPLVDLERMVVMVFRTRLVRVMVAVALVVAGFVGGHLVVAPAEADAPDDAVYKVVDASDVFKVEQYEALLNDMAEQGWVVDHVIPSELLVVFRRAE